MKEIEQKQKKTSDLNQKNRAFFIAFLDTILFPHNFWTFLRIQHLKTFGEYFITEAV